MARYLLVLALSAVLAQTSLSDMSSSTSSIATQVTDIPAENATLVGIPQDTTIQTIPDPSICQYNSSADLYCFPYANAFVTMTGWTRFFYNRNYGLINNSGLVDVTMHFAADDAPAASWIAIPNTGDVAINVNISWFTSTLAPQATYSAADPYYFYVRPNSAVYNAYPTGSSRGPTFYAVQTPLQRLAVAASSTSAATTAPSSSSSSIPSPSTGNSSHLSRGAIAGIAIAAVALFFVLLLGGIVLFLLIRRQKYAAEAAAAAAAAEHEEKRTRTLAPGNLYTPEELAATALAFPGRLESESNDSTPSVTHQNPLSSRSTPLSLFPNPPRSSVISGGTV